MAYEWMSDEVTKAIRSAWGKDVLKTVEDAELLIGIYWRLGGVTATENDRKQLRNFILGRPIETKEEKETSG